MHELQRPVVGVFSAEDAPIPVIIVVPFIRAPVTSRWGAARSGAVHLPNQFNQLFDQF